MSELEDKVLSTCFDVLIKPFEGFSPHVYKDSVGVLTVGYGTTNKQVIEQYLNKSMTEETARAYAIEDLRYFYRELFGANGKVKVPQTYAQQVALVSFCYNLGMGNFTKGSLPGLINAMKPSAQIASTIRLYNKAGGTVLRGLVRRRNAEALAYDKLKHLTDYGLKQELRNI